MQEILHDFFVVYRGVDIAVTAFIDKQTGRAYDLDVSDVTPPVLFNMFVPVRRLHKDGQECNYDARLVSSNNMVDEGELKFVVQLSEFFVPFRKLALEAATVSYQRPQMKIQYNDPEVIRNVPF